MVESPGVDPHLSPSRTTQTRREHPIGVRDSHKYRARPSERGFWGRQPPARTRPPPGGRSPPATTRIGARAQGVRRALVPSSSFSFAFSWRGGWSSPLASAGVRPRCLFCRRRGLTPLSLFGGRSPCPCLACRVVDDDSRVVAANEFEALTYEPAGVLGFDRGMQEPIQGRQQQRLCGCRRVGEFLEDRQGCLQKVRGVDR